MPILQQERSDILEIKSMLAKLGDPIYEKESLKKKELSLHNI
jgi:hypothetical protein